MSKKTDTKAKASDKALATTPSMTNAQMIEALASVGVTAPKKAVKADLEKLMDENKASLELLSRLAENKKLCLIKSFGAHRKLFTPTALLTWLSKVSRKPLRARSVKWVIGLVTLCGAHARPHTLTATVVRFSMPVKLA
jgi:hypothetical protein